MSEATLARDEAMRRVEAGAEEEWKDHAFEAVRLLANPAADMYLITPDDLWDYVEKPREPRALGPVMTRAAKAGLIRSTIFHENSRNGHAPNIRIWASALWTCDACDGHGFVWAKTADAISGRFCDECDIASSQRFRTLILGAIGDIGVTK